MRNNIALEGLHSEQNYLPRCDTRASGHIAHVEYTNDESEVWEIKGDGSSDDISRYKVVPSRAVRISYLLLVFS